MIQIHTIIQYSPVSYKGSSTLESCIYALATVPRVRTSMELGLIRRGYVVDDNLRCGIRATVLGAVKYNYNCVPVCEMTTGRTCTVSSEAGVH